MTPWQFADESRTIVVRQRDDGSMESCLASLLDPALQIAAPSGAGYAERVNLVREAKLLEGVSALGHVWDSDERSRANLTGTVAAFSAGVPVPQGFCWRTKDNQNVSMGMLELVTLAAAMLQFVNAVYQRSWELKAEIAAAQDPSSVDLGAGWPV